MDEGQRPAAGLCLSGPGLASTRAGTPVRPPRTRDVADDNAADDRVRANRIGILAMVGAMACFIVNDSLVKYASQSMPGDAAHFRPRRHGLAARAGGRPCDGRDPQNPGGRPRVGRGARDRRRDRDDALSRVAVSPSARQRHRDQHGVAAHHHACSPPCFLQRAARSVAVGRDRHRLRRRAFHHPAAGRGLRRLCARVPACRPCCFRCAIS